MFDYNMLGKHRFMGQVMIQVVQFIKDDWSDWFQLKNKDGDEVLGEDGTESAVRLTLRFTPYASKEAMALSRSIYDPGASEEDVKLAVRAASGTLPKRRVLLQLVSHWRCDLILRSSRLRHISCDAFCLCMT
jgi:hypothetical protein